MPRRFTTAPWLTAGVAGIVFVALAVVFFAVLLPYRDDHPARGGFKAAQFSAGEQQAITAASTEAANILSYRRAHFQADWQRALDGATGSLRADVSQNKAATLSALQKGKFDLSAKVVHAALEGPVQGKATGTGYVVLVVVNGYRSVALDVPTPQNLQVTVVKKNGKWLASDISNIGVQ